MTGSSGTYTLRIIQLLQGDAEKALETISTSNTFPFVMLQGEALRKVHHRSNWKLPDRQALSGTRCRAQGLIFPLVQSLREAFRCDRHRHKRESRQVIQVVAKFADRRISQHDAAS